jgi:hypothetical protein
LPFLQFVNLFELVFDPFTILSQWFYLPHLLRLYRFSACTLASSTSKLALAPCRKAAAAASSSRQQAAGSSSSRQQAAGGS